jgi:hypothetical protein
MAAFMPERSPDNPTKAGLESLSERAKLAAQGAAGSAVKHLKSVAVVESSGPGVIWEGKIEVFDVVHPPPGLVYVWPVEGENGQEFVAVLGVYPIDSPLAAVRMWLADKERKGVLESE